MQQSRADCPAEAIPTEAELVKWLPECPDDAMIEASERAAALPRLDGSAIWRVWPDLTASAEVASALERLRETEGTDAATLAQVAEATRPRLVLALPDTTALSATAGGPPMHEIGAVHASWRELPEPRPGHPLAPIVAAWQERPQEVELDTRETAIAPQSLFEWAGVAPAVLTTPMHDNELPIRPGLIEPDAELFLPGLAPPESAVVPAPALVVAEEAGFGGLAPGRRRTDRQAVARLFPAGRSAIGAPAWRPLHASPYIANACA